jgi:hypothetical protein
MSVVKRGTDIEKFHEHGAEFGLGFNRWMQHTRNCVSRRSVANETETTHILHCNPESADVGSMAERRLSPADRTAI